jgi:hypothetical protein
VLGVLAIVLLLSALFAVASASAYVAHHNSVGTVWYREFGEEGMGLTIELATLALVVASSIAIVIIMRESFSAIFLEGGWRSAWLLVCFGVGVCGVAAYLLWAPRSLARSHDVEPERAWQECKRPYLLYAPYPIVMWLGLLLPVVAVLAYSIHADYANVRDARRELDRSGDRVLALVEDEPRSAGQHVEIYDLEYREATDTVQHAVTRYLWVVGVFLMFLIVVLNTRITAAYSAAAQDSFKIFMWVFALAAVVICLLGLTQYEAMRDLAVTTHERLVATAEANGRLDLVVATREALLELRAEGPAHFLRGAVLAGIWLVAFGYGFQIVLAKITNRSAVDTIFPRGVAGFLNGFLVASDAPEEPKKKPPE